MRPAAAATTAVPTLQAFPHIRQLLSLSQDERPAPASLESRSAFVSSIDSSPDQGNTIGCECLTHRNDVMDLLWAGFSDGSVRVYRVPNLDPITTLKLHDNPVTCICSVETCMWVAAAASKKIVVVAADTFHVAEEILVQGGLHIAHLVMDNGMVLGVSTQGVVVRWTASSRTELQRVDLAQAVGRSISLRKVAHLPKIRCTWMASDHGLAVLGAQRLQLPASAKHSVSSSTPEPKDTSKVHSSSSDKDRKTTSTTSDDGHDIASERSPRVNFTDDESIVPEEYICGDISETGVFVIFSEKGKGEKGHWRRGETFTKSKASVLILFSSLLCSHGADSVYASGQHYNTAWGAL